MLFQYERYLKSPQTHSRINQFGKLVTTTENGLSKGGFMLICVIFVRFLTKLRESSITMSWALSGSSIAFTRYKIGSPPPTKKRNFDVDQVLAMRNVTVPADSRIELARDLFMLSFYLCGTNAVDLYHANDSYIRGGRFEYKRSKTQSRRQDEAFIRIKIIDEAKPLIEKYLGELNTRYAAYDYLDYALYKSMKGLRELVDLPELTLYWGRHTFGTLARNECRMAVDDIAEALNHIDNGHSTTDIYLAKDWSTIRTQKRWKPQVSKIIISQFN